MGCYFLLQRIFPTQGLNSGLPHCGQTLYCLSHQGIPVFREGLLKANWGQGAAGCVTFFWLVSGEAVGWMVCQASCAQLEVTVLLGGGPSMSSTGARIPPYHGTVVLCLVIQLDPTFFDPLDWSQRGYSAHGIFQTTFQNTGVGCHFLLQGNLPDPGIKPHWQADYFTTELPEKPLGIIK